MLIAILIFGCAVVAVSLIALTVFFISVWSDRRARQMQDDQTIHHLKATRFLQ